MKFLADENFAGASVEWLRNKGVDVTWVAEDTPGISDEQVMNQAIMEKRTVLTHDSDYGELVFKYGFKPSGGLVYFRLNEFEPDEPARILFDLIEKGHVFTNRLTVIDQNSIRERSY